MVYGYRYESGLLICLTGIALCWIEMVLGVE